MVACIEDVVSHPHSTLRFGRGHRIIAVQSQCMATPFSFVVVEGIHGAGKTTVSEMLRQRFGAALLHFTPEFGRFRQDAELDVKVAPLPRLLHYLAGTMQASDLARAHLASTHVVCDRYIVSCVALLMSDPSVTVQEVASIVATYEPYYCSPDLTLLLTVEHSVATARLRRRADRIVSNSQRESMDSPAFFERWQSHIKEGVARRGSYVEIDTSDLSRSEMLVGALDAVADRLGLDGR
jgi:thymidylate kinase